MWWAVLPTARGAIRSARLLDSAFRAGIVHYGPEWVVLFMDLRGAVEAWCGIRCGAKVCVLCLCDLSLLF